MNKLQIQVLEFHRAFGLTVHTRPTMKLDHRDVILRQRLHREELDEWGSALQDVNDFNEPFDYEQLVKEACDLLYVGLGTLVSLGIDAERAFDIVHKSNMGKLWDGIPKYDHGGKVVKPPNYQPPDLSVLWDPQQ